MAGYLCDFFDSPKRSTLSTRKNKIVCTDASVGILTTSTEAWLVKAADDELIRNGLMNRFAFFMGTAGPARPIPPPPDEEGLVEVRLALDGMLASLAGEPKKLELDEEAAAVHTEAYTKWRDEILSGEATLAAEARARTPTLAIKLAIIYAVTEGSPAITAEQMVAAWAVATVCDRAAAHIFAALDETTKPDNDARLEARIMKVLSQLFKDPKEWVPLSSLHQKIGGKTPSAQLKRVVEAMAGVGLLVYKPPKIGLPSSKFKGSNGASPHPPGATP